MGGRGSNSKLSGRERREDREIRLTPKMSESMRPRRNSQYDEMLANTQERAQWIANNLGITDPAEADRMALACEYYSLGGYRSVHNGQSPLDQRLLDKMMSRMPIYAGEIYRGVCIQSDAVGTADEKIRAILNSGYWTEPGITSFSSNKETAKAFAKLSIAKIPKIMGSGQMRSVVLICRNNKSAVPFKHLSKLHGENEVLYPSSIRDNGFRILNWRRAAGGAAYVVEIEEI